MLFFVILLTSINVDALKNTLPLLGKTVVVDIGHGGKDPGTSYQNVQEKEINLKIGLYLEEELIRAGAVVILTREGDYDLASPNIDRRKKNDFDNRIKLINNSNAFIYVSIHQNFLTQKSYSGPQVFYDDVNPLNKEIAKIIQNELNKKTSGKRNIKKNLGTMYLYKKLSVPGVLIECGFISNYKDRSLLQKKSYQKKIALAITNGIIKIN